jgi:DNA replication protein DnaC
MKTNPIITRYLQHIEKQAQPPKPRFTKGEIEAAWMAVGRMKKKDYVYDETAKEMTPRLFGQQEKGVCFCGSKGIGKTLNLDIFATINTDLLGTGSTKIKTECWEVTEIEIQYKATGAQFMAHLGSLPALVINDVGIESKTLNDYGTDRNLIADLLYLRYRAFQVHGHKTYITSNSTYASLQTRFGPRLAERMDEMFVAVELKGESKRKR